MASLPRRLASASIVLLVVALPAMVAGLGIEAPAAAGEWERLLQARTTAAGSLCSRGFLLATAPADPSSLPPAAVLAQARLAQLGGILVLSLLTYLAVSQVAGRARGLLSCCGLLVLPPIAAEGHVLRPETPATVLGLLALVLLLGLPPMLRRSRPGRVPFLLAIGLTAAVAMALAMAAQPRSGILLLLPGALATLVAAQLALRLLRSMLRRSWLVLPLRAATRRLWPWVFTAVASLLVAVAVVPVAAPDPGLQQATPAAVGLLPASSWLRWLLVALLAVGSARLLLLAGLAFGRGGRPDGRLVLLLYCGILLVQWLLTGPGHDALPVCAAGSMLLAEGAVRSGLWLSLRLLR